MTTFSKWFTLLLAAFALLLLGCSKNREVTGQVFVVTRGGENVKLGLVDVHVIGEKQLAEMADKFLKAEAFLKSKGVKPLEFYYSDEEVDEAMQDPSIAPLMAQLTLSVSLRGRFFEHLPPPVTQTDADGQFTVNASRSDWLAARGKRLVGNSIENYLWLMPLSGEQKRLLVSNDRMLEDDKEFAKILVGVIHGGSVVDADTVEVARGEGLRAAKDLIAMEAGPAPLAGLHTGSKEAQEWQVAQAKTKGLPLQVKTKSVGIEMRFVPAGSYLRGSSENEAGRSEDERQHTVVLSKALWVGRFPVTQQQWQQVMGSNPSHFTASGMDAPVESVTYTRCEEFLNKLCDLLDVPRGTYRLLTEAEWEYACRAGTTSATYGPLDDIAWHNANSGEKTHPVGQKKPNAYGLFDLLGNTSEWCSDWYYDTYPKGSVTDPTGPLLGSSRVYRGASCRDDRQWARSAFRLADSPGTSYRSLGLRLARTVE